MRLTRIATTSNTPEYEYGVYYRDSADNIVLRAIRGTHRAAVEWIAEQPNAESYNIARRTIPSYTWVYDWQNT